MKKSQAPRSLRGPREAWITDPDALLAALASAERSAREAENQSRPVAKIRHATVTSILAERRASEPPPPPPLRDDERIGHGSRPEVVVIIRRRRAA